MLSSSCSENFCESCAKRALFRVSAAHGDADKAVGVYAPLSGVLQGVNQRLQEQFDPQGVFRTQRLG